MYNSRPTSEFSKTYGQAPAYYMFAPPYRMKPAMEENEAFDPVDITLFGPGAVRFDTYAMADLIQ